MYKKYNRFDLSLLCLHTKAKIRKYTSYTQKTNAIIHTTQIQNKWNDTLKWKITFNKVCDHDWAKIVLVFYAPREYRFRNECVGPLNFIYSNGKRSYRIEEKPTLLLQKKVNIGYHCMYMFMNHDQWSWCIQHTTYQ